MYTVCFDKYSIKFSLFAKNNNEKYILYRLECIQHTTCLDLSFSHTSACIYICNIYVLNGFLLMHFILWAYFVLVLSQVHINCICETKAAFIFKTTEDIYVFDVKVISHFVLSWCNGNMLGNEIVVEWKSIVYFSEYRVFVFTIVVLSHRKFMVLLK